MAELTYSVAFKGIELPIYHDPEGEEELNELLGKETSIEDCELKQMTFYEIAGIGPYREDGCDMSVVLYNGMDFICPWTYERLKSHLEEVGQ